MNLTAWLFCIGSLAACLGVSALLYPHAALDSEQMALLSTPQPMENFDQVIDSAKTMASSRLSTLWRTTWRIRRPKRRRDRRRSSSASLAVARAACADGVYRAYPRFDPCLVAIG